MASARVPLRQNCRVKVPDIHRHSPGAPGTHRDPVQVESMSITLKQRNCVCVFLCFM